MSDAGDEPAESTQRHEDEPAGSTRRHEDEPAESTQRHEDEPAGSTRRHEDEPAESTRRYGAPPEWVYDDRASAAFPFYSRAILGDLCPDPVTPLTATVGIGAELGRAWAHGYAAAGHPLPDDDRMPVASFGGYLYLNTSLFRLFGVSAGSADPMAFARQYLGERPDVPRQRDERPVVGMTEPATLERMAVWSRDAASATADLSSYVRAARRLSEARSARPNLDTCSDAGLVDRIVSLRGQLREALRLYAQAELATAFTTELLTRTTEDAGFPGLTGALVSGLGGTVTEEPIGRLYELARQIAGSDALARLFDQGAGSLAARLDSTRNGDVGRLRGAVGSLRGQFGHVGPAEWELSGPTWGTDTRLLLATLDVLRHAEPEPTPAARAGARAERGAESAALVRRSLHGQPRAEERFDAALRASGRWLLTRQRIRQVCSGLHHEQRLAARVLGLRHTESGLLDNADQIFMLLADELAHFVAAPEDLGETLRMRSYDYQALRLYQPPFVTIGQPPPVIRWPRSGRPRTLSGRRGLSGTAASPGTARGPARVMRTPWATNGPGSGLAAGPRPGDVLVIRSGGPGWIPLLPVVAGVVIDGGAALSDVAVAARDLGIPCVAATVDATERISQGASVEIDGFGGIVTVAGRPGSGGGGGPGSSGDINGSASGPPPPGQAAEEPTASPA